MTSGSGLMAGKKGLIMGVANDRSIAWHIAKAAHEQGAEMAFTFQGEALQKRVTPLAESVGSDVILQCDVTDEASVDALFKVLQSRWGKLDFAVHAIAYSDKEELKGKYVDTTLDNFAQTMMISCYSFTSICQKAQALMADGGSLITLTYAGAERVMPHYNVMGVAKAALEASVRYLAADVGSEGIRVNAISAGPIKTLSAAGIKGMRGMLDQMGSTTPLGRNVDIDDVGGAAVFALSDLGRGMTGDVIYVDAGYHALGAWEPRES